jgi:hypothetical protein
MRIWPLVVLAAVCGVSGVREAVAQTQDISLSPAFAGVTFLPLEPAAEPATTSLLMSVKELAAWKPAASAQRPVAIEYSDAYRWRGKVHRIASFATLPLFVAEGFVGQSLYSDPTEGKKTAHLAIASGIGALFAVNAVTGVWNLIDSRKDTNGRTRRLVHSVLMIAASGAFFATAATGPENEGGENGQQRSSEGSPSTHRALAFTSIGLATTAYLIMLFNR